MEAYIFERYFWRPVSRVVHLLGIDQDGCVAAAGDGTNGDPP